MSENEKKEFKVNLEKEDREKLEDIKEYVKEHIGRDSFAHALRESVRISHKKIKEWKEEKKNAVQNFDKTRKEIQEILED